MSIIKLERYMRQQRIEIEQTDAIKVFALENATERSIN